ncbi:SusC/RagA family TonB-linked outer membrane protein [Pedobacter sp. GR22-6]|uniref:SusC/RagA family TonB-linked outer membrane protein n=1 Tax=Pedobacter sp. GR22-6 TaxID=3127957 RepID=UPI00307E276F
MRLYTTGIATTLMFLLMSALSLSAQTQVFTVKGRVTDRSDKQPIPGASVTIIDKDKRVVTGVSTDIEGNFSLRVTDKTYRISVSYIGYKSTAPLVVGDKPVINFQLEPTTNELEAVNISARASVDDGTGMNRDKRNSTAAIASIDAKEMAEMQVSSIDQALVGRLPGMDIAATSGDPGSPMQIRIRGTSSINGATDPLIVVDGMPFEITIPDDFNFATSDDNAYGQLLNIAPSDIKDISVLKDAAATAVWGSRAANGVLVINTKRGSMGPPSITYNFKGSYSKQPTAVPMLNGDQYSSLILEEFYNAGRQFTGTEAAKEFQYDPNDPFRYHNFSNNTDWIKEITQIGYFQDHNLQISGGGERAKYLASVGYFDQQGTTKGTALGRINARINLDYTVSDRLRFRSDVSYVHIDNDNLYLNSIRDVAYRKMPNQSVYEYDEYGNLTSNYFSPVSTSQGFYAGTYNPLAMALAASSRQLGENIIPKFNLRYDIIPGGVLVATGDLQFNIVNKKVKTFLPQIATGRPFTENVVNRAADSDVDEFTITTKTNLLFKPDLGKNHTLNAMMSLQSNDYRYTIQGLLATNTASSNLADPSIEGRTNVSGSAVSAITQSRSVGALLSATYGLLDRYLVSASIRGDGSSKFGPNNRYGVFPSVSARWRISGEPLLRGIKGLDELSLRASYGKSGNTPRNDYRFFNIYQNYGSSYLGESGVYSSNMELSDLRWETVTQSNLGLDLAILKSRLYVTAEIYRKRTSDLFYQGLQISSYNGYTGVDMNVGVMDNQGWEFSINGTAVKSKNWNVDLNFNISHNENVIREISRLYPRESARAVTANGVYKTYLQENNPFGSFYGFKYLGVYKDEAATIAKDKNGTPIVGPDGIPVRMNFAYPAVTYNFQPGDAMYEDINHDGTIDYKDIVYLGNSNPKLTGGFGGSVTYKGNLTFKAFFSFRQGMDLINGTKMGTTSMIGFNNQSTAVLRRWRKDGDETDVPRALYGTGYNSLGSSRYVEDASFLRVKSVTALYRFSKNFLKRLGLSDLSGYLTADNLFTFTKYTGQDPEVAVRITGPFSTLVDNSMTPPIKTFTLGLSARF